MVWHVTINDLILNNFSSKKQFHILSIVLNSYLCVCVCAIDHMLLGLFLGKCLLISDHFLRSPIAAEARYSYHRVANFRTKKWRIRGKQFLRLRPYWCNVVIICY